MIQTHTLALGGSAISKFRLEKQSGFPYAEKRVPFYDEETMGIVAQAMKDRAEDFFLINLGGGAHAKHNASLARLYHGCLATGLLSPGESTCSITSNDIQGEGQHITDAVNIFIEHTAATNATLANAKAFIRYLERFGFKDEVFPMVLSDFTEEGIAEKIFRNSRIAVTGGYLPGVGTTDASAFNWYKVINGTNMVKVSDYTKLFNMPLSEFDPEKIEEYKAQGKEIDETTFTYVRVHILNGETKASVPNGSYALDPVATILGEELAKDSNFTLKIGKIGQLEAMLDGVNFEGTRIRGALY